MSRSPFAAYPLIKDDLVRLCIKLMAIPPCQSWIHESVVARFIGLPIGNEYGQSESLTALLACLKKGYGGDIKRGTRMSTGHDPIQLENEKNDSGVSYQMWGKKEPFTRGKDSTVPLMRRPRWFKFGDNDIPEIGQQMDIVNELIGNRGPSSLNDDDPTITVYAARRRKKFYLNFYKGQEQDSVTYRNYDVPAIAAKHLWLWPEMKMKSHRIRRRSFSPEDLLVIEADFRLMIVSSNILGRKGKLILQDNALRPARNTRESRTPVVIGISPTPMPTVDRLTPPSPAATQHSPTPRSTDGSTTFPDALRLECIKCTDDGTILWDMISELASLELLFQLVTTGDCSWDVLEDEMLTKGVDLPSNFQPIEVCSMTKTNLSNARRNINIARDDLMDHMGEEFFEPKHDELLFQWLRDGKGYSEGRRVEANNFTINPSSRARQLSITAAWKIRHIFFAFNLPAVKVGALWACFYALIMDRMIPLEYFTAATTIWNNSMLLQDIDKTVETSMFRKAINKLTKHGFQRFFFSSSDDSKHFKLNRHVLVISSFDDDR